MFFFFYFPNFFINHNCFNKEYNIVVSRAAQHVVIVLLSWYEYAQYAYGKGSDANNVRFPSADSLQSQPE